MTDTTAAEKIASHASTPKAFVPSYHFDLKGLCYCRSGENFGDCCANSSQTGKVPVGIHVISNFVKPADCKRMIRFAEKQKRSSLSVVDTHQTQQAQQRTYKKDKGRITQRVQLGKRQELANQWFYRGVKERLAQLSQSQPEWYETPHMLRYGPGGRYVVHSDSEHFDEETKQFYRFIDRDFSMLIYLNDDYSGGELNFPWLRYRYQPTAGDLVMFPSNHVFAHESLPIVSGAKYALVSWGAFRGSPRVGRARSTISIL